MAKIYIKTVLKWLLGSGLIGLTGVLLFSYLSNLGLITINSYDWSKVCAGTPNEKCWATINFTVSNDTFIYPSENWSYMFGTDKPIKNVKVYRNWGTGWREIKLNETCTGTWCGAPNNKGVAYSFALRKGKSYIFRFEAEKYSSYDDIKWGFEKLDPIWEGYKPSVLYKYDKEGNLTDIVYHLEMPNMTIETPVNTECEWNASEPLRKCHQPIYVELKSADASLSMEKAQFSKEASVKFSALDVKNTPDISKGVKKGNYTINYEFNYPANTGEEWNLTFDNGLINFKIDPEISACSNITSAGVYTLTAPITNVLVTGSWGCMHVTTSNVEIDCVDWSNWIDGTDAGNYGIYSKGTSGSRFTNVSIKNCNLTDWSYAIYYTYTTKSILNNIIATSNGRGVMFTSVTSFNNLSNMTLLNNILGIYLSQTSGSILSDMNVSANSQYGVQLYYSPSNNLTNVTVSRNSLYGFNLEGSTSNVFTNVTVLFNSLYGVYIYLSSDSNIFFNIISSYNDWYGIFLSSSNKNQIINSTIQSNKQHGLYFYYSRFNNITGTRIENNSVSPHAGIMIESSTTVTSNSSYNRIWNNIINNTPNGGRNWKTESGLAANYTNYFNTTKVAGTNIVGGANIGGNYWSDYTGTDSDADGFGDTTYIINATKMNDSLPLVYPVPGTIPPIVTILSPTNTTYSTATGNIPFNVSLDEAGSACLLELDKTANITMTKQSNNLNFNWTNYTDAGSHNARFYCNDTTGNMNLSGLNNVTFFVSLVTDTCSCPAINNDWDGKWADNCTINSVCNIGTGTFHLYGPGAGTWTLNAQVICSGKQIEHTNPKSYLINETNLNWI